MLEVRNLVLAHGRTTILSDVSFSVASGEVVALCGPNGAGKSTLLSALSGEMPPVSGAISIKGCDITGISAAQLAKCRAVLEQAPTLSATFDVRTLTSLSIPREVSPLEANRITRDTLAELDLTALSARPVHSLSGGQQHRVHLARTLAQLGAGRSLGGGDALMLDEPTASLDITHQITVMQAARRAAERGTAVIVVLHDLNLAAAFADRIVMLHKGGIAAKAPPAEVLTPSLLTGIYETEIAVSLIGDTPIVTPVYLPTEARP